MLVFGRLTDFSVNNQEIQYICQPLVRFILNHCQQTFRRMRIRNSLIDKYILEI